jgi:hypothetical protein
MGGFCVVAGIMGSVQRYDHRSGGRHDDGKVQRLIERLTSEVGECGTLEEAVERIGEGEKGGHQADQQLSLPLP